VAIDESLAAVEVVKRRGVVHAEVRSLTDVEGLPGVFDTILLLRNNFGLAGKEGGTARLLRRLAAISSPQERIITTAWIPPDRRPSFSHLPPERWLSVTPARPALSRALAAVCHTLVLLLDVIARRAGTVGGRRRLARAAFDRR